MKRKSANVEPLLVPRIEQYALNKSIDDVLEVAQWLRSVYREYERKPQNAFVNAVSRAISVVKSRGVSKPELTLEEDTDDGETTSQSTRVKASNAATGTKRAEYKRKDEFQELRECSKPSLVFMERKRKSESSPFQQQIKKKLNSKVEERKSSKTSKQSNIRYEDLGGLDKEVSLLQEIVERPLKHPEIYSWLGVEPPRGVLLHGPPGCGKTAVAQAVANETGVAFFSIAGPEVVSGMSGESESRLRDLFAEAKQAAPSIIFIDEIDSMAPKRETAHKEMERRIVAQLLSCMDDLNETPIDIDRKSNDPSELIIGAKKACEVKSKHVSVIGATNRPDSIDPALRRAGRFDREVCLGVPDEKARESILQVLTKNLRLGEEVNLKELAKKTPGYVAADLKALTKEAAASTISRSFETLPKGDSEELSSPESLLKLAVTYDDFITALSKVQPSIQREGFATVPGVTWADVGALDDVKDDLYFAITLPIQKPEKFEALGLKAATGVLLYGPPGCGKTLVAKAIANDCGANFISVKGPELLNKYVGESERSVRQLFARARAASPCVLFFDELDALAPRRGNDSGNAATERVVNQLLTEMDGTDARSQVYLIATTNRPDIIDPALLRPGRLDKLLYVPLPKADERVSIAKTLLSKSPVEEGLDWPAILRSDRCAGYSGADIAALVRECATAALRDNCTILGERHFERALQNVQPSVSRKDEQIYEKLRGNLRRARGVIAKDKPN